jgi:hypothetical protein
MTYCDVLSARPDDVRKADVQRPTGTVVMADLFDSLGERGGASERHNGAGQAGLSARIHQRLRSPDEASGARLPRRLPGETGSSMSVSVARRLALAGAFGRGGASAGRSTSAPSSGYTNAFHVGPRQRVTVKAFVGRHGGPRGAREAAQAVGRHLRYLAREALSDRDRSGGSIPVKRGMDGSEATFYGPDGELERDGVHAHCAR